MPKEQILVQLNPDTPPTGSDLTVVNAARRSFGERSDWDYYHKGHLITRNVWENLQEGQYGKLCTEKQLKKEDRRLIEYLARGMTTKDFESFKGEVIDTSHYMYKHDGDTNLLELLWQWRNTPTHDTPFNHVFFSFEVKAPIFVARQLVKTEYTIFSEFSRRYITDNVEFYEHDYREVAKNKKQGSGDLHHESEYWKNTVRLRNLEQLELYNTMIKEGVAPEQARGVLPQDLMTAWTWSGTLGAFAKMCRERLGSDVQKETSYVAEQVYEFLKQQCPVGAKSLVEGC